MYISVCVCLCECVSVVSAGWQVDKGEDVVLDEAGETQEDGVEEETRETQALVQRPLVQVNSQDLDRQRDRQRERQTDRQADKDKDKDRQTGREEVERHRQTTDQYTDRDKHREKSETVLLMERATGRAVVYSQSERPTPAAAPQRKSGLCCLV